MREGCKQLEAESIRVAQKQDFFQQFTTIVTGGVTLSKRIKSNGTKISTNDVFSDVSTL
jgi:hypothetical protein